MTKIEKAGMLVNAEKEVIGWVNAGDETELKEGDLVISHPKTAEKHGLLEQYAEMKAANAPKKEKKVKPEGEGKVRGPRTVCPKTGTYTVVKADAAVLKEGEESNARHEILSKLLNGSSFEAFWEGVPEKFEHLARDKSVKSFATSGLVVYAISRGMITVNA